MYAQAAIREIGPEEFPHKLREIPDPPEKLFLKGAEFDENIPTLCVVGSRKMSTSGRRACETLVEGLRGYDVQIISGLAYGIDSVAHKSALRANLTTIAVPGSGINEHVLYPRAHVSLASDILAAGGTVLSEFDPDQAATGWTFPQRNRIMARLSDATLLVEAAERSGTLITGRLALEYNREVCVVPGDIFSKTSRGTNALLRDGATPVLESADLIEILHLEKEGSETSKENTRGKQGILALFEDEIEKDELLRITETPRDAQAELTKLEISGEIEVNNGRVYKKYM